MKYKLRPYQQEAVNRTIEWVKSSIEPCLVEMSVGAGKSLYIAEVARLMHQISGGKKVLCLAPRAELCHQNRAKYLMTGNSASLYSSSAGSKCLKNDVVFATPGTFKRVANRLGVQFCAVVVDECEGMTPTIRKIIDDMRDGNRNLRVIGTTGTPFTTNGGYVYRMDENNRTHGPDAARDPYFAKKLYTVTTRYLLSQGYLTPLVIGETGNDHYDAISLAVNSSGNFDSRDIDRVFVGHGRKTAYIVADLMERFKGRKSIVIFAATVQHADEVLASLHPGIAAVITGETKDRASILRRFDNGELRVLINVNVLTVGWDCPRVDAIALLRATESIRLLTQIIGRGLRLCDGKDNILLLDYAQNIERHAPSDGDIFNPQVKAQKAPGEAQPIDVECPECSTTIQFNLRPNEGLFDIDKNGYYTLEGQRVMTDHGPSPAHYGRRCYGLVKSGMGSYEQCSYRWTFKPCPECDAENDIAARYCTDCKGEIVDPGKKLIMEFKALKKDPTRVQTDRVISMEISSGLSRSGNETLRADFTTPYRKFSVWFMENSKYPNQRKDIEKFNDATDSGNKSPDTITYRKDPESSFYRILSYGMQEDAIPTP